MIYIYIDKENGKLLYYDKYNQFKSYDIATKKIEDCTYTTQTSLPLAVENFELSLSYNYKEVLICNRESGETVLAVDFRNTITGQNFATKLTNGKYLCSVRGCLMIIDINAL